MNNSILKFILSITLPFVAAFIGSYFTFGSIANWYVTLNKPFFSPPNFVFGPVWTVLYFLMGISLFIIWNQKIAKSKKNAKEGIWLFLVQIVLNALWSIVFFGLQSPVLGIAVIIILWIFIFKTLMAFAKVSKTASYLLYPYLAWVTFAFILNTAIVALN